MVSFSIVAHCTFTTNLSSKFKSQVQIIFSQDFFPPKMSPFQVILFQNSKNCLLINERWNACFYHYSFYRKFPISSCKCLVYHKMFLFLSKKQFWWSYLIILSEQITIQYSFSYACRWLLFNTTRMSHLWYL